MGTIKLKNLQSQLENIETFENPKIEFEQYTTSPLIAASILHTAQFVFGDIKNKTIADLGCGSGILSIGAVILGAEYCTGFDIDPSALALSVKNASNRDILDDCNFVLCDIKNIPKCVKPKMFDTVIMNPPFGTKVKGADLEFLKSALHMANSAVYSLHKTSTRKHIQKKASKWNVNSNVVAELRYDLPASYAFHKENSVDVYVDLIRFSRKK
ncbi:DNA methylase, N-6 adenine-specific, conserved site,S-adenosyl-L-methionine-dependent methyltransferase [Cinara cedri]|uniref:DNA methylase, N-6 adenine-specific, conserved site,S-adenosyl-L-methionine-dependent methyltransferase n=1 Tax=Cinara cedri TaxID=506608 RepID=A0A5E4NNC4_9HEMI|nr:DNA methylase, N-6 adenine-specific, conserved site,S-adenosyl-L-methionine-dependent methyltransferase [Cinara cedri]